MDKSFKYRRLERDDATLLLVDHQAGLIPLVPELKTAPTAVCSPDNFQHAHQDR